jgi:hypothetical protein
MKCDYQPNIYVILFAYVASLTARIITGRKSYYQIIVLAIEMVKI